MGRIVSAWRIARLGDVARLVSGGTPPKADPTLWKGDIPWVSPKDMKRRFLDDVPDHISAQAAADFSKVVPENSVLIVVRGMILAKDFPVALIQRPMAINQDMKAIVATDAVDPRFLVFALLAQKRQIQPEVGSSAHGTRRISTDAIENLLIPIPPRTEQNAIATILCKLQEAIDIQTKIVKTLGELKTATIVRLFREGTRSERLKYTEIGQVPESWAILPLGSPSVATIRSSSISFGGLADRVGPQRVLAVKVSDMNSPGNETTLLQAAIEFSADPAWTHRYALPPNTIIMPKRGAAIATNKRRIAATPVVLDPNLIGIIPAVNIHPDYLYQWSLTLDASKHLDPGAVPQVNKKDLDPVLVPIPDAEEQRSIAAVLTKLDVARRNAEARRALATELFHEALFSIMSGDDAVA